MNIDIKNLTFGYGNGKVLSDISFSAHSGEFISLLGSNGVGKSTLFKCILGLLNGYEGSIEINGQDIKKISRRDIARLIAYIPQSNSNVFNYTVLDTVLMGVSSRINALSSPSQEDILNAEGILSELSILHLKNRGCAEISGGERQLALLARALMQNAGIFIMDEPTASLDYGNQHLVLQKIKKLTEKGYITIMSTHDPNHAFLYCDRVIALKDGSILSDNSPEKALTEDNLRLLYGTDINRIMHNGHTFCVPKLN